MRLTLILVALFLAAPLHAAQISIDAEHVHLNPENSSQHGFLVKIELFDPVTDEYSVAVSAPHESMHRTFSHFYVGRYDSLAIEVVPELSKEKHNIQLFLPLEGFEVDETEITVVYKGERKKPVFFKIDVQNFIEPTVLSDRFRGKAASGHSDRVQWRVAGVPQNQPFRW
jgi:hypothetical protein